MTPLLFTLASPNSSDDDKLNQVAKMLLSQGADVYARTNCVGGGCNLRGRGYSANETILDVCWRRGNNAMALHLLQSGHDPYICHYPSTQNYINEICDEHGIEHSRMPCFLL